MKTRVASKMGSLLVLVMVPALLAIGCGDENGSSAAPPVNTPTPMERYSTAGPYAVGNTTLVLSDPARERELTVEIWYPAAESARRAAAAGVPAENFFPAGSLRDQYAALLEVAPADGPTRVAHSARDAKAEPSGGSWPLVLFSHCHECARFSEFEVAERLASHGIAVAAPDHAGNTLFDPGAVLTAAFLQTRAADIRFVTDALLARGASGGDDLASRLAARFDPQRLGVFGHSFGGVTTGLVLQDDSRFRAGVALAAPPQNPILPGVRIKDIHQPLVLIVAREDNSISEFGNQVIRGNFTAANPPVWKIEVADAGHWSFSSICGIVPGFSAGCGAGIRQTVPDQPFEYLSPTVAVPLVQRYVTAFFAAELQGDDAALEVVSTASPAELVEVQQR